MGLYDDDHEAATSGDLLDVIYWQTKFAALQLEAALASRQPEWAIRGILPGIVYGCVGLLQIYPNHAVLRQWLETAQGIEQRIDPNAPPADFKSGFAHWRDFS
jgi:hypothetical protein